MPATLSIDVSPEVTISDGTVYCDGREVGRVFAGEWKDGSYTINMRIDDEEVYKAVLEGTRAKLEAVIEELRRPVRVVHAPGCLAPLGACVRACHFEPVD